MRRIPSLNALRAFEAAAATGSFREAAERLHVTASAISHQIKGLEDELGVALFARGTRKVTLTEAGQAYLVPVREALERLAEATERVSRRRGRRRLTISAAPSFASSWLMPRLPGFQLGHPDLEVRLDASVSIVDLWTSDVDVAIRYTGRPHFPGLAAHRLMQERLVPVCAPALAGARSLREPRDIPGTRLIHTLSRMGEWRAWLASAGVREVDPEGGLTVENDAMAIEAAVAGLGLALVVEPIVRRHLADGRLVAPFAHEVVREQAYYLVYPQEREREEIIAAFRDWLLAELD